MASIASFFCGLIISFLFVFCGGIVLAEILPDSTILDSQSKTLKEDLILSNMQSDEVSISEEGGLFLGMLKKIARLLTLRSTMMRNSLLADVSIACPGFECRQDSDCTSLEYCHAQTNTCVLKCTSTCSTNGAQQCSGNNLLTCADYNADGCLEWGDSTVCPFGCSAGACLSDPCVPDPCNGHGTCNSGACSCNTGYGGTNCSSCAAGYTGYPNCILACYNECSYTGEHTCSSSYSMTCGEYDYDACLEFNWGSGTYCDYGCNASTGSCNPAPSCDPACGANATCQSGTCVCNSGYEGNPISGCTVCPVYCSPVGKISCNYDIIYHCVEVNGCYRYDAGTSCGNNARCYTSRTPQGCYCESGYTGYPNCVPEAPSCTDACTSGATRCFNSTAWQTCGDYNGDGCTEWGNSIACTGGCDSSGCKCYVDATIFNAEPSVLGKPISSGWVNKYTCPGFMGGGVEWHECRNDNCCICYPGAHIPRPGYPNDNTLDVCNCTQWSYERDCKDGTYNNAYEQFQVYAGIWDWRCKQ